MTVSRRNFTMRTPLPHGIHAARPPLMRVRITSLLVLIGLFFGTFVMPAMAHASGHSPVHAGEMVDVHEISDADHSKPTNGDSDMPCHAVSHHHCSVALPFNPPRLSLSSVPKAMLVRPASTSALASHSQAPPLDPPNA